MLKFCHFDLLLRHKRGATRVLGVVYAFLRKSVLTMYTVTLCHITTTVEQWDTPSY
jgi:hypothetical protein